MDNKIYSFSTDDAIEHGVDEAILLHNIRYWLDYARSQNQMEQDGYFWMFMTASKMQTIMPFWSANKIQKMLKKLVQKGVLITGEYNKSSWDRTKWYTMPEFKHSANSLNGESQTADSTFSQTADSLYDQYKDGNNSRINYKNILNIYNTTLTKAGDIHKITPDRKKLVKKFFSEFDLTEETFKNYLEFINEHEECQWMFEKRPKNDGSGQYWQPCKFEYFLSEKCYLNAKENL